MKHQHSIGTEGLNQRKKVKVSNSKEVEDIISSVPFHTEHQPKGVFKASLLQDEEENEDLEPMNRRRKKDFKSDVYGSDDEDVGPDSDDDSAEEDEKEKKGNDDEDENMFGDEDQTAATAAEKKKKFLQSNDIEGQEWLQQPDQDNGDENDEIPAIESFNMDQELAEGDFTQSGVYIRKKDEQAIHDSWLSGIGKKEIAKAKLAHEASLKREQEAAQRDQVGQLSTEKCLVEIFHLLQPPSETVMAAIKRLGAVSSTVPKWKKNATKKGAGPELSPQEIQENKEKLDRLSSLATTLFDTRPSIYEMTYADIAMALPASTNL